MLKDGSITTASAENSKALDLYRKKAKIISLICLLVGAVGLGGYIVAVTVLSLAFDGAPNWLDVSLIFAVPFTLGLIGSITIARLKSREKKENRYSEIQFFADCFVVKSQTARGAESKRISYLDGVLKGENDQFGYIVLTARPIILPFSKENLQKCELNAIYKLFKKPTDGDCAELENYKTEENN